MPETLVDLLADLTPTGAVALSTGLYAVLSVPVVLLADRTPHTPHPHQPGGDPMTNCTPVEPTDAQLWQQIADSLNTLAKHGVRVTTGTDSTYIGPDCFGAYSPGRPGLCVVSDATGRWSVEDRTIPCAECGEPLKFPGAYCSTRCRNAADRHDQDVEVDA